MKCRKCGELIDGFATKCPVCGASLVKDDNALNTYSPRSVVNPVHSHEEDCSRDAHPGYEDTFSDPSFRKSPSGPLSIQDAIRLFFTRFADFRGRSRRSEYWWPTLLVYVLEVLLTSLAPELGGFLSILLFVPCLSLGIRRLHDIGRSGWWHLLVFVPFGALILIFLYCKDSAPANKWGENPKL